MESLEEISSVLESEGEDLIFLGEVAKGFPGNEVYSIAGYSSPYEKENQEITFTISLDDFLNKAIEKGTEFTFQNQRKIYSFSVLSYTDTLHGWVILSVELLETSDV